MPSKNVFTENHSVSKDTVFRFKSFLLVGKRRFQNLGTPVTRFSKSDLMKNESVISFSESDLWNPDDNDQNWILTAGKIQNLRIAAKSIHGIEITANSVFSFWKHIGNPNIGKGYVIGREIREGCIVPTKAGGLCQISNALYDAALKANFEIIERHKHTKVIKGSLAEMDRDATVKWNYVDLRFKSKHAFRIEADLTADKLIISFKGTKNKEDSIINPQNIVPSSKLNDCYSCGNVQCFKHPTGLTEKQKKSNTTFILDEYWPEYDEYIHSIKSEKDIFILPLPQQGQLKSKRYSWLCAKGNSIITFSIATIRRSASVRLNVLRKKNPFKSQVMADEKITKTIAQLIPIESTHLVISQNLLVGLYNLGVLAGRTYDVLMTRLPVEKLHARLDMAHQNHPQCKTLIDFRIGQDFIDAENKALTQSRKIITPHSEIALMFNNKSIHLSWKIPAKIINTIGDKILFPGSTIGRKGAYEVRRLSKELNIQLRLTPNFKEDPSFWNGINIEPITNEPLEKIGFILYPVYIEQQPRFILKALSRGIKVITTTACGLPPSENLVIIAPGDYEGFKRAFLNQSEKVVRAKSVSNG